MTLLELPLLDRHEDKKRVLKAQVLNTETVCFSEILVSTGEYTRCQNPEEQHRQVKSKFSNITETEQ